MIFIETSITFSFILFFISVMNNVEVVLSDIIKVCLMDIFLVVPVDFPKVSDLVDLFRFSVDFIRMFSWISSRISPGSITSFTPCCLPVQPHALPSAYPFAYSWIAVIRSSSFSAFTCKFSLLCFFSFSLSSTLTQYVRSSPSG